MCKLSIDPEMNPYVIHAVNPVNECSGVKSRPLNSHGGHKDAIHIYKKITLAVGTNRRNHVYVTSGYVVYTWDPSGLPVADKGIAFSFGPDGCLTTVARVYFKIIG